MTVNRREKWILAILAVAVVAVWSRALTVKPQRKTQELRPAAAAGGSRTTAFGPAVPPSLPPADAPQGWGASPFLIERGQTRVSTVLIPVETGQPESYSLNGILWDPQMPTAVVNNRVLGVGDRIGSWKVVRIQKDRVVLSDGHSTQELTVQ